MFPCRVARCAVKEGAKSMNLNNLYYFKVMAEFQHYTRAAQSLCITQPSLSHAIASLERDLGVKLFRKEGRNVTLTKYGLMLQSYVSQGFHDIEVGDRLLRQFSRKNSGIIDLSFLVILGYKFLPQLIKRFYEDPAHEGITVNFSPNDSRTAIGKLKEGDIDLCLCTYVPDEPDIEFTPLVRQELVCIVANRHPLAKRKSVLVEELLAYPIIRYIDTAGEIQLLIDQLFADCGGAPSSLYTLLEEITMAGIVSTGYRDCFAVVPDLEILQHYAIKKIPIQHPGACRNIFLAASRKHPHAPCVELFKDYTIHFAAGSAGGI